jgi:hypothetical protein
MRRSIGLRRRGEQAASFFDTRHQEKLLAAVGNSGLQRCWK